jgi:hypothetical protein
VDDDLLWIPKTLPLWIPKTVGRALPKKEVERFRILFTLQTVSDVIHVTNSFGCHSTLHTAVATFATKRCIVCNVCNETLHRLQQFPAKMQQFSAKCNNFQQNTTIFSKMQQFSGEKCNNATISSNKFISEK